MKTTDIKIPPHQIDDIEYQHNLARKKLKVGNRGYIYLLKKSIDARNKTPHYLLRFGWSMHADALDHAPIEKRLTLVSSRYPEVLIIGAGPAGYFAALQLIELGLRPIVLDRGKDVQARRRDLRAIQQFGEVNPHSNYCFGEGGAGTYSDGKLYTRSHKRGKIIDVLNILYDHGAPSDILTDAHPHIGSNKLPKIVAAIRKTIEEFGGEVHFNTHVTDLLISNRKIQGVVDSGGKEYIADAVILATGHSARDIYRLLNKKNITLEKKPFALGVRIEHPQPLIDKIQYGKQERGDHLPAASYKLVCQVEHKGVFSFCMCPGGLIVPAATAPEELVVNGMSLSRRDSPFANSGFVTAIDTEEMEEKGYNGLWGHLDFQMEVEKVMFQYGDGSQKAPAQRITDFVDERMSKDLPSTSYIPGVYTAPMHELLPDFIVNRLQIGLKVFGKRMKGYFTEEAQIVGVESRTSSPVKIPRDSETLQHPEVVGLFPCGEGAGYAGGILSAAMDGQNVAKAVNTYLK